MDTYTKEEIKKIDDITFRGYPLFNKCSHTLVDLSELDPKTEDWMHTFSVKLPNGRFVTLNIQQCSETQSCVDVKFYNEIEEENKSYAFRMENGSTKAIEGENGLYAIVSDKKGDK